jgi:hypothetical protein
MQDNLPVKVDEDFIAEFESMDLTDLKDRQYIVAINQGDRNGPKYVCSSIKGPFSFEEMCEQVGLMWRQHQHHAKVTILDKEMGKQSMFLDENTVDYIEAHYEDIVTESMLDGVFDDVKEYTCKANIVQPTAATLEIIPNTGNSDAPKQDSSP